MQEFKTDISLNGNQAKNIIIDQKDSFPPVSESYEGRKITLNGISYIFHNGAWQSMAEDLGGRPEFYEEDFIFQPTANIDSIKDGLAKIRSIKGNTLLLNQLLIPNPNPVEENIGLNCYVENGKFHINGKTTEEKSILWNLEPISVKKNHTYCFFAKVYSGRFPETATAIYRATTNKVSFYFKNVIGKFSSDTSVNIKTHFNANETYNLVISFFFCDITEMFSLSSHQSPFNASIKFLIPNISPSYNNESFLSLNFSGIKTVGFNAFNGTYAKLKGGVTYYLGGNYTSLAFKINLNASEQNNITMPKDRLYTPYNDGYIVAEGSDICINISHTSYRNGFFEEYIEHNTLIANGKLISELTSNGNIIFPYGLQSAGSNVYDELTTDSEGRSIAIKRVEVDLENLTTIALDNPITYILDEEITWEYPVYDFGTESIISSTDSSALIAEIQYGFNAVDLIRQNRFNIISIFKELLTKLSLSGGIMNGAIDMSANPFINAGFENVEELPTVNNFIGRQVFYNSIPYYWNGSTWISLIGTTGDFWSLTQANAEVSACEVAINNSTESIFPKVLASYGDYIHSRNIVVDLSNYSDESNYVFDLFGDISNVPTGVRYSIFITGNNPLKLDFPKQYLTNISAIHTPDGAHEESYTIAYSSATKIDFVKLGANKVWVDVSNKM